MTHSKKLKCLDCFYCMVRVFSTVDDLNSWCCRRSIKPNPTWPEDIISLGSIRLMWCEMQTDQYCSHGFNPRNTNPKHTMGQLELMWSKKGYMTTITNQNNKPFIPDCPYMEM